MRIWIGMRVTLKQGLCYPDDQILLFYNYNYSIYFVCSEWLPVIGFTDVIKHLIAVLIETY